MINNNEVDIRSNTKEMKPTLKHVSVSYCWHIYLQFNIKHNGDVNSKPTRVSVAIHSRGNF